MGCFTFLFGFAIFNIITGIIVEKAVTSMLPEMEEMVLEHNKALQQEAQEFRRLCEVLNLGERGRITLNEFKAGLSNASLVAYMAAVGLRITDVSHFFQVVAGSTSEEIDFDQFITGCLTMKGSAKTLDVEKTHWQLRKFRKTFHSFEKA